MELFAIAFYVQLILQFCGIHDFCTGQYYLVNKLWCTAFIQTIKYYLTTAPQLKHLHELRYLIGKSKAMVENTSLTIKLNMPANIKLNLFVTVNKHDYYRVLSPINLTELSEVYYYPQSVFNYIGKFGNLHSIKYFKKLLETNNINIERSLATNILLTNIQNYTEKSLIYVIKNKLIYFDRTGVESLTKLNKFDILKIYEECEEYMEEFDKTYFSWYIFECYICGAWPEKKPGYMITNYYLPILNLCRETLLAIANKYNTSLYDLMINYLKFVDEAANM